MDKKMLSIILAVVLIGCFFLAYLSIMGLGFSGYDYVFKMPGNWEKYVLLLIPVSGVMLLIGALNNGNYIGGRTIWTWLPLLTIVYFLVRMVIEGAPIGDLFKVIGIGLWISLAASLVLAFYNPKAKA
jgi:hypothetical protein